MKKKVLALVLAACMIFALAACAAVEQAIEQATAESADAETYSIGICQFVQHDALDAATQGFKDVLTEEFGDRVTFDTQNASAEVTNCSTIVNGFVSDGVDLIMANATPALTAAASATADIPILGTSVTAYGPALEIENFSETTGCNVSGTSDLADLTEQANMILEWFPEAKTVGLLFCSAEANSRYQVDEVSKILTEQGLAVKEFSFTDSNDVTSVTQAACDACDVLYIPTDNTAASNAEAIANIILPAGKAAICGEENLCKGCGIATLSIDYYELGRITGNMAVKVLRGEAIIGEMPIEYYKGAVKKYNPVVCEQLGLSVPEGYVAIAE